MHTAKELSGSSSAHRPFLKVSRKLPLNWENHSQRWGQFRVSSLHSEWDKNEAIKTKGRELQQRGNQWFVDSVTLREDMQWGRQVPVSWGLFASVTCLGFL